MMRVLIRGLLRLAGLLLLASAVIIAFLVIPAVRAGTYPNATPERAVPAFWVNVLLTVLAALAGFVCAGVRWTRTAPRRVLLGVSGLVALLLGLALIDATTELAGGGPQMRGTVAALWLSVVLDLAGGAALVVAALQRVSPAAPQT